jgi:hypothetical protein
MVHRHGACIHAATCQRYSGILTGNSAGQAMRSIREIELATFHLYNRRPKQPSAVDWLELALCCSLTPCQAHAMSVTHCGPEYESLLQCTGTRAKRAKKSGRCTHGPSRFHLINQNAGVLPTINYSERAGETPLLRYK